MKRILALLLVVIGVVLTSGFSPQAQGCGSNPIVCENNLIGNPQGEWDVSGAGDATLQGFATDISINKGDTVHFKVSTTAALFQVDIYRMGYYGGMGARKVESIANVTGQNQVPCLTDSTTLLVDCGNWSESATWAVPASAVSGIYFAKLSRNDTGGTSHVVFIVRDDSSTADMLFQTSDTTWQAYNQYGGYSTYTSQAAFKVSYNRPFSTRGQVSGLGSSNWVFYSEYPTVRWLEANGYNVSYATGVDTERYGALVRNHKAFLSVGHDEYWSAGQRASVEAARAAGVHLAFLSGNELFWKIRFEPSIDGSSTPYRTLVTYKETHSNATIDPMDPPTWTGTWHDPRFSPPGDGGRPENALTGQFYAVNKGSAAIQVPAAYKGLRFWRNTAVALLAAGQVTTLATDTLGYEWDIDADNGVRPPGLITMSSTTVANTAYFTDFGSTTDPVTATHNLTLYRHSSGALVFGAGSVQWVWGLDPNHDTVPDVGSPTADLNIQQATMNVFGDMGIQPQTRQPGLFPAVPSTDVTKPTSTITSPANGASILAESATTIAGTAADAGGGVVGGVEISVDGGTTWHRATGTTSWTYAWRPGTLGATTIRTRAVDDSGNLEVPGAGRSVTITQAICPCSLWPASAVPWAVDIAEATSIEVGTKFRTDLNGFITALRFYKAPTNTGTHTGHLWTAGGVLLGSVTFSGESASGWQQATLTPPVRILQDQFYVVSYHTNVGHYSADSYYFGRSGLDQWPLHAPSTADAGGNGVYAYGDTSFPTQTYQGANYWVDVVIGPVDSTPPSVSITAPVNGAALAASVSVTATATDNLNAVVGVQFKLDGVNLGAEDTASPYAVTWNTTATSNNPHVLTAVARDISGNVTTSAPVAVTVFNVDSVPPTVSLTAPANGAMVAGNVNVSATAADINGVVGLQFLLDGAPLGAEFTAPPYTMAWDTTSAATGPHSLTARARDAAINQATSTAVSVSVANGSPLVDVTVATDRSTSSTTLVSPAFSTTSGNELLLAFVSTDDAAVNMTVTGITGGGLTWQLVRRTNVQRGDTEIWRAFAAAPLTAVSVTATLSQSAPAGLTVMSFTGVDTSGTNGSGAIGATGSGNGLTGAPTATLTSTRAKSWVFGVGNDYDKAIARTLGANQTMVHQYLATAGDTFWVQRITIPVSAGGISVTINDTAPTADLYNMTLCEVLPPFASGGMSGTVSPAASGAGTTLTLSGAGGGSATADASGNFALTSLIDGAYTVTPSKAGFTFSPTSLPVTVAGAIVAGVNFTATAIPNWSISGTVNPAASGTGTTLTLSGTSSGTRTADASGNFSFTGLTNGSYTVTPSKSGFTFSPASLPVTVAGANVAAVNFTATAISNWSISGTVNPAASGTGTTLTLSGTSSGTRTADASGNFSFTGLTNGSYTVTPSKSGFTFSPASLPVTVSGADVTAVNFTATALTWSVSGTVNPAAAGTGTTLNLSGTSSGSTTADASGNFTFTGLTNGSYTVTPSKSGFTFSPASLPVTVAGANVAAVNFTATAIPNRSISGTVSPAASGTGTTLTLSGTSSGTRTADASGNFTFTGLANGSYTVTPSKSGFTFSPASQPVTVSGADVTGVNFTATAIPNWSISGTVSPAANGTGTTLTLSGTSSGTRTADASGNFSFTGLANGSYTVTLSKSGFTFSPLSLPVTVTDASVSGVNFAAQPVVVSGTISGATSVTVTLTGGATTVTDASGNYAFSTVANGAYTVSPSKTGYTFTPASRPVTVSGASVGGVDFTATLIPTFTISGTVTPAASGSGATLTLSGAASATTLADSSGNYTFSGLLNGSYTVTPTKPAFTFAPASQAVTISGAPGTANFTAQAAATSILIDVTTTTNRSTSATTIATPAFSTTAANELLLALIATDNSTGTTTITGVAGGGVTWQLVRRTNTQRGTAEIWRAFAPTTLSAVTATATISQSVPASITVMTFKGVDTSGVSGSGAIGNTASGSSAAGAPTATLITTRGNSLVVGVGNDWDNALARTVGSGQTVVSQYLATVGDTFWVQRTTNPVPVAGTSVTINDTAPTGDQYNLTLCEILPGS